MSETIFADGIYFDKPREGAPDFVRGRVSIKAEVAIPFIQKHTNEKGYVNLDLLKAREGGKLYLKLNDFKPTEASAPQQSSGGTKPDYPTPESEGLSPSDVPF